MRRFQGMSPVRSVAIIGLLSTGAMILSGAVAINPTEVEAIQNILELGGQFDRDTGSFVIPYEWTGSSEDLTQLA
jgi:hypothetical protein